MKILCYSDLQATNGHEKLFSDPTKSLQVWRVNKFYGDLLKIYQENKCDGLADLGDTFDDRGSLPVPAVDAVFSNLNNFPTGKFSIRLTGNHDQFLRPGHVHNGAAFAPYFNVVEANSAFVCGNARILCCSYPGTGMESETVRWIESQKLVAHNASQKVILLGHFQVMGCMTGDGRLLAGISKDVFSGVDLGLLGHIHKPQSVSKRVHYVGSPFQQNWGESEEDKRVGIVDVCSATVEWIPLPGFPKYRVLGLEDFKELCTPETEDRFQVVLKSQAEAAAFYALPLAHRAEPIYEFIEETNNSTSSESATISGHRWSFDSVVQRYVERNLPEAKGIPASVDEMVDYGKVIAVAS